MSVVTLIVPYYRNVAMLREQLEQWIGYPEEFEVFLVDDGSPEPALDVLRERPSHLAALGNRLRVYRIGVDIPWNRGGARNLGTKEASSDWVIHIDIDHLLPAGCAAALLREKVDPKHFYRFPRFRRGVADETRRKDDIPDDCAFGPIKPHIDSYLVRRSTFWKVGGYDEDYSGCLGGGSPFLRNLEARAPPRLLSADSFLVVYTRSVIADASDFALSRDTTEYSRRRKEKEARGKTVPTDWIRFPWERVL